MDPRAVLVLTLGSGRRAGLHLRRDGRTCERAGGGGIDGLAVLGADSVPGEEMVQRTAQHRQRAAGREQRRQSAASGEAGDGHGQAHGVEPRFARKGIKA
jgi:hypothetical protein